MKGIQEIGEVAGKRVLVRIDADAPTEDGRVVNSFRLEALLPTISFLTSRGAKVILLGHLGRDKESVRPIYEVLQQHTTLSFIEDVAGDAAQEAVAELSDGGVLFLENVRKEEGEIRNDDVFAQKLASLANIYVNEAFAVSHREHASIVGVPKYLPAYAGIQFQKEIETLSKARTPESPSLFILGGAKFETKLPLIKSFSTIYDAVFVGGALANNFFKARGFNIGTSLISGEDSIETLLTQENIFTPLNVVVKSGEGVATKTPQEVTAEEKIVDAGSEAVKFLHTKIKESSFILWNGPLGEYENGFGAGTDGLAAALKDSTAQIVAGGGDTIASIASIGLDHQENIFLSTGGGAMLKFLLEGTLPGIEAL